MPLNSILCVTKHWFNLSSNASKTTNSVTVEEALSKSTTSLEIIMEMGPAYLYLYTLPFHYIDHFIAGAN